MRSSDGMAASRPAPRTAPCASRLGRRSRMSPRSRLRTPASFSFDRAGVVGPNGRRAGFDIGRVYGPGGTRRALKRSLGDLSRSCSFLLLSRGQRRRPGSGSGAGSTFSDGGHTASRGPPGFGDDDAGGFHSPRSCPRASPLPPETICSGMAHAAAGRGGAARDEAGVGFQAAGLLSRRREIVPPLPRPSRRSRPIIGFDALRLVVGEDSFEHVDMLGCP